MFPLMSRTFFVKKYLVWFIKTGFCGLFVLKENAEYSVIAIAPRSTLTLSGSTW